MTIYRYKSFIRCIVMLISFPVIIACATTVGYAEYPTLSWPDGSQYNGEISQNRPEGKGRFVWANGSTYDGDWRSGRRTGKGVYVWPDGRHYRGDFLDDEMHGKGTGTWPGGMWYEGNWEHNRRTGEGVLVLANGDRYSGDFLNDNFHGKGTLLYRNGTSVTGLFVFGIHKKSMQDNSYDNTGASDGAYTVSVLPDSKFLVEYPNGNFYKGDFSEGWFAGKGVFTFADGTSLSGNFHTNRFVYGKKTYSDGTWYLGSMMENYSKTKDGKKHNSSLRHGFGTYYAASGAIIRQGHWGGDNFVESTIPAESPMPIGPDDEDILI